MSKRQFWLGIASLVVLAFVVGPAIYFTYQKTVVNKNAEVQKEKVKQDAKVERTKQRWDPINRCPFLRKKSEEKSGD